MSKFVSCGKHVTTSFQAKICSLVLDSISETINKFSLCVRLNRGIICHVAVLTEKVLVGVDFQLSLSSMLFIRMGVS